MSSFIFIIVDDIYAFPYGTSTEALDLIKTEGTRLLGCNSLPTIDHPLVSILLAFVFLFIFIKQYVYNIYSYHYPNIHCIDYRTM